MKSLSAEQLKKYEDHGFVSPIDVLSSKEATKIKEEIEYIEKNYYHIEPETGRRYALGDVSGPGGASKGNPRYSFLGVTRYYRFSKKRMEKMYREGRIVQKTKGTVPLQKRYLDEMPGMMLQDLWTDIKNVQVTKKEDTGYSTQKPLKLLERIIQILMK